MAVEDIIDFWLPTLQQGVDVRVPLKLILPEGATDTSVLALADTDRAILSLRKNLTDANPVYTFSTDPDVNTIDVVAAEGTIYLYFTDTDTLKFIPDSATGLIILYGTLLVEDTTATDHRAASRPCSGRNIGVKIRPSFTRPAPVVTP